MSLWDSVAGEIKQFVTERKDEASTKKLKVKLAGDGASMTRNTSFELFSFSLLDWGKAVLSPSCVQTVAVFAGEEDYEMLRDGIKEVFFGGEQHAARKKASPSMGKATI